MVSLVEAVFQVGGHRHPREVGIEDGIDLMREPSRRYAEGVSHRVERERKDGQVDECWLDDIGKPRRDIVEIPNRIPPFHGIRDEKEKMAMF